MGGGAGTGEGTGKSMCRLCRNYPKDPSVLKEYGEEIHYGEINEIRYGSQKNAAESASKCLFS